MDNKNIREMTEGNIDWELWAKQKREIELSEIQGDDRFALNLLEKDSYTYYITSVKSFTISHNGDGKEHIIPSLRGNRYPDLNEKGKKLYSEVLEKVNRKEFKDTINNWYYDWLPSGSWLWDKKSPYYVDGNFACLNCHENMVVCGYMKSKKDKEGHGDNKENREMTTSVVRFYGDDWIYTCSGSLYALGTKKE